MKNYYLQNPTDKMLNALKCIIKRSLIFLVPVLCPFFSSGQQNLVPNGSFEEMSNCPSGIADFSVSFWYSPTWGSCDYFNTCNGLDAGVPNNYFGHQNAETGNGYVGFGVIFDSTVSFSSREYIQVELLNELNPNKYYYFSCFINKSDSSSVCVSEIGIAFSSYPIGGAYLNPIPYTPQIISSVSNYICDSDNWIQIEGFFHPNGGEKYLTIGYFKSDQDTDTMITRYSDQGLFAYYYLDNVVFQEVTDIPNIFTPNHDGLNETWYPVSNCFFNWNCEIFNRWGNRVYQFSENEPGWNGLDSEGNELTDGVYYYRILSNETVKSGFIELIR